jgi:hypothetical protein
MSQCTCFSSQALSLHSLRDMAVLAARMISTTLASNRLKVAWWSTIVYVSETPQVQALLGAIRVCPKYTRLVADWKDALQ